MKQKWTELKGKIDSSIVIVRNFNTPFSVMDRADEQEINKEIKELKRSTIMQLHPTDIQ